MTDFLRQCYLLKRKSTESHDVVPSGGRGRGAAPSGGRGRGAARTNAEAFEWVYKSRSWGGDGFNWSLSGGGSSIEESQNLCTLLAELVQGHANSTSERPSTVRLLDAPMGDWFWMSECLPKMVHALPHGVTLDYQGVDVAATALAVAERRRALVIERAGGSLTLRPFVMVDLAEPSCFRSLPVHRYEIVMCNDALMHLPVADIYSALANLNGAGLQGGTFVTNADTRNTDAKLNSDILRAQFRPVNLRLAPFHLRGELTTRPSSSRHEILQTFSFPLQYTK